MQRSHHQNLRPGARPINPVRPGALMTARHLRWPTVLRSRFAIVAMPMLTVGAVLVALWSALWISLETSRNHVVDTTEKHLHSTSVLLARHADRALLEVDETLKAYVALLEVTRPDGEKSLEKLNSPTLISDTLTTARLGFVDENGNIVHSTAPGYTIGVNIAERLHFSIHSKGQIAGRYISAAIKSKAGGSWSIYVTRAVHKPDGSFGGVAIAAIDPSAFSRLYADVTNESNEFIALLSADGRVQVSYPFNDAFHHENAMRISIPRERAVQLMGKGHIAAAHALQTAPFTMLVATPLSEIDRQLQHEREFYIAICIALTAVILLYARVVFVQNIRVSIAVAELEKSEIEKRHLIARQNDSLQDLKSTVENLPVGICMYDPEGRIRVCNTLFADMYELPVALVERRGTFKEVVDHRIRKGLYPTALLADGAEGLITRWHDQHAASQARIDNLTDGRAIRVERTPLADGGWVALHDDITEKQRTQQKIVKLAHCDSLTGLANRRVIHDVLGEICEAPCKDAILLLLDLDHFKSINDSLGHAVGDQVLITVGERLTKTVRSGDVVARLGGDEFMVIARNVSDRDVGLSLASRIIKSLSVPMMIDGSEIIAGTSIGIALAPLDGDTPDRLMQAADIALYRAKNEERNSFRFFQAGMIEAARERRLLEINLRQAIGAGELVPYYQPIVEADGHRVTGYETLLRWCHPSGQMIPPSVFIPLAEDTGLIVEIGTWLIDRALDDARLLPEDCSLSLNVSPKQLLKDDFVTIVADAMDRHGIKPGRIIVEITEAVMLTEDNRTLLALRQLRELGIRIALDDFGTGYSSLGYLQRFPIDIIKIDRKFIENVDTDSGSQAIVKAIAAIARAFKMTTTAEGIETLAQAQYIKDIGCTHLQGYYFGKPEPAAIAFACWKKGAGLAAA
jgi:diguanylate cyclase (GGDEF)-like protein